MIEQRDYGPLLNCGNPSYVQGHRSSPVPPVTHARRGGLPAAPLRVEKTMQCYLRSDSLGHRGGDELDLNSSLAKC
jgi:hypothetical protein